MPEEGRGGRGNGLVPLVDLLVMVKMGAGKMCADLFVESVRSVIAFLGVNNVRLVQAIVAKEHFQLIK